jgi:hypothetical protein
LDRIFGGIVSGGFCAIAAAALFAASCGGSKDGPASPGGSGGVSGDAGSDAPTAGSGGGPAADGVREACLAWCEKQAEANCPGGTPREQCPQQCDRLVPLITCAQEYAATRECIATKASFECLDDGKLGLRHCWTEIQPLITCNACQVASGDETCDACMRTSCCAQLKAYWGHPDLGPYLDCTSLCDGDAGVNCLQECAARYPNVRTVGTALQECRSTCRASCPV